MPIQLFNLEFTRDGEVFDQKQVTDILEAAPHFTDMFVASHGWNNDVIEAQKLYSDLFDSIMSVLRSMPENDRTFAAVQILWPSKRFDETEFIPGGGAASASAESHQALIRQLEFLKVDAYRLGGSETTLNRASCIDEAKKLAPLLESSSVARTQYVTAIRSLLDQADTHSDDASTEFFSRNSEDLFDAFSASVSNPGAPLVEGVADLADNVSGNVDQLLSGVTAAARRIANYATYYSMKTRAGLVGRIGVAPILRAIRTRNEKIRIHMIGHSFGGRVVTAAASELPVNTADVTLSLLQAAYSHNGLAKNFDGNQHDGAFRTVLSEKRASGPIIITNTKNDQAVGIAYPLASRFAMDQAASLGDRDDPYGGMGRNGAQHTPEVDDRTCELLEVGQPYDLRQAKVYNLRADRFVKSHGDVAGQEVAYAIVNAVFAI